MRKALIAALALVATLAAAPAYADASLPADLITVETDLVGDFQTFTAVRPEEGTKPVPVTCTVHPKGHLTGQYHYGALMKVDGAYSINTNCDTTVWRIHAEASLTQNGTVVGTGPYFYCEENNCTSGTSTNTYGCHRGTACAGTYLVASFVSVKLYNGYYFTQYPRGCGLYESNTRMICNPLKSTPMYLPAYK